MSCSFRVPGRGGGSRTKQTYLRALPSLCPCQRRAAGSWQIAACHGVTGKRQAPPLEPWKPRTCFTSRTFFLWPTGHRSASVCSCKQHVVACFLRQHSNLHLKPPRSSECLLFLLPALARPSRTHSFSSFHGERHGCFLGVWEKERSADFPTLQVFWWLPWFGGLGALGKTVLVMT